MQSTSVPRQLLMFMVVLCAVTGAGSLALFAMISNAYATSARSAADGVNELTRGYALLERIAFEEDAVQRLIRTRDADLIESTVGEIDAARVQISALTAAAGASTAAIRGEYERTLAVERQVVDAVVKGDAGRANDEYMEQAVPRYAALKSAVRDYFAVVQRTTMAEMKDTAEGTRRTMMYALLTANLVVVGLVAFLWGVRRNIAVRLGRIAATLAHAGGQLADTSTQVTESSRSVSQGVNRLAAAIEQTSASFDQIGATSGQNAAHAEEAKQLAGEARSAAEAGHRDMQEMRTAMDAIKASSGAIASIIKTIDEIAFQTNLLALNAAVEAARAGERGLGFAVVADEVRALAQRSATAARETASSVEAVIAKSERGVDVSGKVAHWLEDIVSRTRNVDTLVAEIAGASAEQRAGVGQVSLAIGDMEKVTQAGAITAEQTAATVQELHAQANALRGAVLELQRLAGDDAVLPTAGLQSAGATPRHARAVGALGVAPGGVR